MSIEAIENINSSHRNFILLKCYPNQILGFHYQEKNVEVLY